MILDMCFIFRYLLHFFTLLAFILYNLEHFNLLLCLRFKKNSLDAQ